MENSAYAISAKASSNILHALECDPAERPTKLLYTATSAVATRAQLADLGNFQLATQGMSAEGVTLGELHVVYDIEFFKKQMIADEDNEARFITPTTNFAASDNWSVGAEKDSTSGYFEGMVCAPDGTFSIVNDELVGRHIVIVVEASISTVESNLSFATVFGGSCVGCTLVDPRPQAVTWNAPTPTGVGVFVCALLVEEPTVSFALNAAGQVCTGVVEIAMAVQDQNFF
jgi:hypothetical protein